MGIVSLCRLLGEVCEGSIGQGGLRFKVQKMQGLPFYAFPIFQKSCSWRQFETDLKLGYRDLIQIGGFGLQVLPRDLLYALVSRLPLLGLEKLQTALLMTITVSLRMNGSGMVESVEGVDIEAVSEGGWTSLSGIYIVEEVDFMSQLLGNFVNQTSIIGIDPDLARRQL